MKGCQNIDDITNIAKLVGNKIFISLIKFFISK